MSNPNFYDNETIQKAYTAKKLLDLAYLIAEQVPQVYSQKGMIFPAICSSTLMCLNKQGSGSVTEIAHILKHPHQTVAQHLKTLSKLGIIKKRADKNDKRRTEYSLTALGKEQAEYLDNYNLQAADVFKTLDEDIGVDLGAILDVGIKALRQRPMVDRFWELFDLEEKD